MAKKRNRKKQQEKKSYGERILALVGKSWVSTGKIIKSVGCPPRAARRVLRGLVKSRDLKSVKVQRERYFAAPGTKSAPPKAENVSTGNGRSRTRSRKSASKAKRTRTAKGGKKAKARRRAVTSTRSPAPKPSGKPVKKAKGGSGNAGTPASAPSSEAEIKATAEKTVAQSGAAEQSLLS